MVCSRCGCEQGAPAQFCRRCGVPMVAAAVPPYMPYYPPPRVANHLQPLAILWFVFGALRLISGLVGALALHTIATGAFPFWDSPSFVPRFLSVLAPVVVIGSGTMGVASLFVGWSLITRKPWARTLAIVIGIIELLKIPFGTALGIYTLWVLAPARSGMEWDGLQHVETIG